MLSLILGLHSAATESSVALARRSASGDGIESDGMVLRSAVAGRSQSEWLLSAIDEVLAEHQASLAELSCYVVAIGPGHWTGIRVGLAIVLGLAAGSFATKGLAIGGLAATDRATGLGFSQKKQQQKSRVVVGVSTLDALADKIRARGPRQARSARLLLSVESGRADPFFAFYNSKGDMQGEVLASAPSADQLHAQIEYTGGTWSHARFPHIDVPPPNACDLLETWSQGSHRHHKATPLYTTTPYRRFKSSV